DPPVKVRLTPLNAVVPVVPIVPKPVIVLPDPFAEILPILLIALLPPVIAPPSVKSLICNVPVDESILVPPPLNDKAALLPEKILLIALLVNLLPTAPFSGERIILPVVLPPIVKFAFL